MAVKTKVSACAAALSPSSIAAAKKILRIMITPLSGYLLPAFAGIVVRHVTSGRRQPEVHAAHYIVRAGDVSRKKCVVKEPVPAE
jgi:hypothetical protein